MKRGESLTALEELRRAGYTVRWTTPDHDGDPELAVYERYTGLHGQERFGLVDVAGRVWHYDSEDIYAEAQLEGPLREVKETGEAIGRHMAAGVRKLVRRFAGVTAAAEKATAAVARLEIEAPEEESR